MVSVPFWRPVVHPWRFQVLPTPSHTDRGLMAVTVSSSCFAANVWLLKTPFVRICPRDFTMYTDDTFWIRIPWNASASFLVNLGSPFDIIYWVYLQTYYEYPMIAHIWPIRVMLIAPAFITSAFFERIGIVISVLNSVNMGKYWQRWINLTSLGLRVELTKLTYNTIFRFSRDIYSPRIL